MARDGERGVGAHERRRSHAELETGHYGHDVEDEDEPERTRERVHRRDAPDEAVADVRG